MQLVTVENARAGLEVRFLASFGDISKGTLGTIVSLADTRYLEKLQKEGRILNDVLFIGKDDAKHMIRLCVRFENLEIFYFPLTTVGGVDVELLGLRYNLLKPEQKANLDNLISKLNNIICE
jgi:hypothetical protein